MKRNRHLSRREFLAASASAGGWLLAGSTGLLAGPPGAEEAPAKKSLLILGGTRFLGPEVVAAAKKSGWTLTLFNRGKTNPGLFPDLEQLHGDRNESVKALEGRTWDAVVDTSGYFPRQIRMAMDALRGHVGQYVFISSISVYADTSTPGMDETAKVATIPDETTEKITEESFGALKALCEKAAEAAMPGHVTNIRPGLIVGPHDTSDRFTYWPVRLQRGGDVLAPGDGTDIVQYIDARDLAEWTIRMAEARTVGVFNAAGPDFGLTMMEMLLGVRAATTAGPRLHWVPVSFLEQQKVQPWADMPAWVPGTGDMAGFSRRSNARAVAAGLTFRPLAQTALDTRAWFESLPADRRAALRAGIKPEREREVLAAWQATKK